MGWRFRYGSAGVTPTMRSWFLSCTPRRPSVSPRCTRTISLQVWPLSLVSLRLLKVRIFVVRWTRITADWQLSWRNQPHPVPFSD